MGGNYDIVKKVLNWLKSNSNSVAAGTVIAFAGKIIPNGYLLCNGAAVSRSSYAKLFQAIGTTYGRGDGSTTFNLPNLNQRFVEGTVTANNVGTTKAAGLPNITGKVMLGNYPLLTSKHEGAFFGTDYGTADTHGIAAAMSQRLLELMLQGLAQFTESQALFSRHLCVYFTALSIKDRE